MQHGGRRDLFPLQTPNKAAASAKAQGIYLCLLPYAPVIARRAGVLHTEKPVCLIPSSCNAHPGA